jgi:FtsP/CotA-like multicopper oxidase with cupredoxin domain/peroxiredoxin
MHEQGILCRPLVRASHRRIAKGMDMKSQASWSLLLLLGATLGMAALFGSANQKDPEKSKPPEKGAPAKRLAGTPCQVTDDDPTWAEPTTYFPANNRTVVKLSVCDAVSTIGKDLVRHRSYNGGLVGPVIRTRPGHKLLVHLVNKLPVAAADIDPLINPKDDHFVEVPHGFNTTNLHTHGLHVSPNEPGDHVFLQIDPLVKKEYQYTFDIRDDHPAGTFWYHAHNHGSVALQLASGMAGALIVEGGLDDYEGLRGVKERIMVFQQMPYRAMPGRPALIFAPDVYGFKFPNNSPPTIPPPPTKTLINGQLTPVITMRPGEIQRWRMIHAGLSTSINVHLEEHTLTEVAYDGIPLKRMRPVTYSTLVPAYRIDVLVKASLTPGTYCLYNEVPNPKVALRGMAVPPTPLAKIVVEGMKCDMPMPDPAKLTAWVSDLINTKHPQLKDIDKKEITGKRSLTFRHEGPWKFFIDGKTFRDNRIDQTILLGAVEEWTLTSELDLHPFHIHVNPFQVPLTYPDGTIDWVWRDTILLNPAQGPVTMRSRFLDYPGKTVLHCHNLDHEDQGMMQAIEIVKKAAGAPPNPAMRVRGLARLPAPAPEWTLTAADGHRVSRDSYKGRHLLLVFHRGLDCLHCSEQLSALAKATPQFRALGVEIAAISPQWPAQDEVRAASTLLGIGFPLLADPTLSVFRLHGCHENQPLHAVFLIDPDGQVRWQSVSEQPEVDSRRLLALVQPHVLSRR